MRLSFYCLLPALLICASCRQKPLEAPVPLPPGGVCVVTDADADYKLQPYVQVLADSAGLLDLPQVLSPGIQQQFTAWDAYDAPVRNHQYYWGKIQLKNQAPDGRRLAEWVLSFTDTWSSIDIFLPDQNGAWRKEKNGAFIPDKEKGFAPTASGNHVKLMLPPGETVTVYFRGISERTAIYPSFYIRLAHVTLFYNNLVKTKAGNALFFGFILMMLFYNLILFFIGGGRSFLFYSAYLFMVVVYSAFSSDDIVDWFNLFPDHPAYPRFLKLSLYMGMMFYLTFIRSFVHLHTLLPRWDKVFKWVVYLGFPLMIADVIVLWQTNFSYVVEDRLTVPYITLIIVACAALMYPLWKTKDRVGYFVVAGIASISLGCLLTVFTRVWFPPFSIVYLKAGIILEMLIFSLGLAYRQRREKHAQQQAEFRLRESSLVQEKKQLEADRLKELNDFKARFYTNITHEFRTPLTVIMGMTENIAGHEKEKNLIRRNGQNLLQLINQLLDLSKLESDTLTLHYLHGDIIPYLQYLTESFYSAATQKNIRLVFYAEEKSLPMDYDENKIQQIVYNLLSNALKFSRPGGQVVFHAGEAKMEGSSYLRLVVKDNGIGISEAHIGQIFNRFYQANPDDDSSELSSGIGLALVKELVGLMQGTISVHSEPDKGTAFTLLLPITANAPAAATQNRMEPQASSAEIARVLPAMPPETEPMAEAEPDDTLPELLIIEDNADIISYIASILGQQYHIHTATNGNEGIDRALDIIPSVIISDVMMPGKNGYEVCDALKQDERTSHIPIILLTAKATQADKLDGLRHGADAYLTKPFDKKELQVLLSNLIAMRRQLQEHYAKGLPAGAAAEPTVDELFLQRLAQQIDEHLDDAEFGVVQLAAAVHMSQMQVYRKLKGLTGQTPSQFIRSHRLRQAQQLLRKGGFTIAEIAYAVGFNEPSYFSRVFQQEFGTSPSDFIK